MRPCSVVESDHNVKPRFGEGKRQRGRWYGQGEDSSLGRAEDGREGRRCEGHRARTWTNGDGWGEGLIHGSSSWAEGTWEDDGSQTRRWRGNREGAGLLLARGASGVSRDGGSGQSEATFQLEMGRAGSQ